VFEELLPAAARAVEVFDDPPEATLYPEEEACVARAVRDGLTVTAVWR
jgi:hypothetical protein